MKANTTIWILLSLLLLSACSSSDSSKNGRPEATPTREQIEAMQTEADKIINREMDKMQRTEASTWPCSLFPQAEVEALAGNPLDKGSYVFNNVTDNDREYKSESCDWSAKGGDGNEVGLWVSLPKHFKSGQVECSPGSPDHKISGIGDQAWWEFQKYWGAGTLRVCSPKAMLEVKVTLKSKDEASTKKIAQAMAEKVLASH